MEGMGIFRNVGPGIPMVGTESDVGINAGHEGVAQGADSVAGRSVERRFSPGRAAFLHING